jgi:hypothetical protein
VRPRRPRHILTHRCPSLPPRDVTRQRGVPTTNPARSPFEDDFLAFVQQYNLPTPLINVYVNGREINAFFPDHKAARLTRILSRGGQRR